MRLFFYALINIGALISICFPQCTGFLLLQKVQQTHRQKIECDGKLFITTLTSRNGRENNNFPEREFVLNSRYKQSSATCEGFKLSKNSHNENKCDEWTSFFHDNNLIQKAEEKLVWEILEEQKNKPVLNLSVRDASLEDEPKLSTFKETETSEQEWIDGGIWYHTLNGLKEIGVFQLEDTDQGIDDCILQLLRAAPQLLRLDTNTVLETASILKDEISLGSCWNHIVLEQPTLLTFPPKHVRYGVDFLITMISPLPLPMIQSMYQSNPQLLLSGIEGGLQEQSVGNALQDALAATSSANKRIVGDSINLRKSIKNKKPLL